MIQATIRAALVCPASMALFAVVAGFQRSPVWENGLSPSFVV
jgi:hypothetical protein